MSATLTEAERIILGRCPSVWAERFRWIRTKGTATAAPWTWNGYAYLREIHDTMAERAVVMSASQSGKTETLVNRELHVQHVLKLDTMHLFPAADEATDFSAGRFQVAVEQSPRLRGLHGLVDNKGHRVTRDGANAYFRGMSRSKVKSVPVSFLAVDELDECDPELVEMARDRLMGQPPGLRWELDVSTPGLPGHRTDHEFGQTDRRLWNVRCPHCAEWTPIHWHLGADADEPALRMEADGTASAACSRCRGRLRQQDKAALIAGGHWVPTAPDATTPGWHVQGTLAPLVSWADLLTAYGRACANPDPKVLRAFFNGKVGIAYAERGYRVSRDLLMQHAQRSGRRSGRSDQAVHVAVGVDAGVRGHYVTVAAQTPTGDEQVLHTERVSDFTQVEALVLQYDATAAVIDAQPNTESSRALQKRLASKGIGAWLCYYSETMKARTKWDGEAQDGPQVVAQRTELLNETMGRLAVAGCVYPVDVPAEVLDHVVALQRVTMPAADGNLRTVWTASGPDHFAHSLAYARLALEQASMVGQNAGGDDWATHGFTADD